MGCLQDCHSTVNVVFASVAMGMGIYLYGVIGRAKRAPHWGVQSRFRVIYIYIYVVVCQINCVGGITCGPRACSKSFFGG